MTRKKAAEKPALPKFGRPTSKTHVITIHHAPPELKRALVAEAQQLAEKSGIRVSLSEYVAAMVGGLKPAERAALAEKRLARA